MNMAKDLETFEDWHGALLVVNCNHNEFGLEYPMGSCCYRDLIRDKKVYEAMKDAWKRIIEGGQDPIE